MIPLSISCFNAQAQKVRFEGLKRTKPAFLLKFIGWEVQIPTDAPEEEYPVRAATPKMDFAQQRRILVVDDHEGSRDFLQLLLERRGVACVAALVWVVIQHTLADEGIARYAPTKHGLLPRSDAASANDPFTGMRSFAQTQHSALSTQHFSLIPLLLLLIPQTGTYYLILLLPLLSTCTAAINQ